MSTSYPVHSYVRRRFRSAVFFAALVFTMIGKSAQAIPSGALTDPRYALGYLVVSHYGATPNDGLDDTAAIQTALDDAYDNDLVLFFPTGTYQISDTLKCRRWRDSTGAGSNDCGNPTVTFAPGGPFARKGYRLAGEHGTGGVRPLIKLVPVNAAFDNKNAPKPMLMVRLYEASVAGNTYPANWTEPADVMDVASGWIIDTAALFGCELRNIDFDCNDRDGAIGVAWPSAQRSVVESVKVVATGAHAGFYGLPGRHWGAINIEVVGGDYGIRSGYGVGGAVKSQLVVAGMMLTGVTLTNQTIRAIDYSDFVPMVMVGFKVTKDFSVAGATSAAPLYVKENSTNTSNNTLTLMDGRIELTGGATNIPAIENLGDSSTTGKGLYVRNVYVQGTTVQIKGPITPGSGLAAGTAASWNRIKEYVYNDLRGGDGPPVDPAPCTSATSYSSFKTESLIDGNPGNMAEPVATSTAVVTNDTPPPDLISRHLPAGGFPYYEGAVSGPQAALVVTNLTGLGIPVLTRNAISDGSITANGVTIADNNRLAIQAAIDYASDTGPNGGYAVYKGRVFIPKGIFQIRPANLADADTVTGGIHDGISIYPALTLRKNTVLFGLSKQNVTQLSPHASWLPSTVNAIMITTDDVADATAFLGCLDLRMLDDVSGQPLPPHPYLNPFTFLHWRAGPGSSTFNLSAGCDYFSSPVDGTGSGDILPTTAAYVGFRYSGNAGGRHYFFPSFNQLFSTEISATQRNKTGYRTAVIDHREDQIKWPLWFYGFNIESGVPNPRDKRDSDVEIFDSANIALLGWKREGGAPMLKVRDSSNLILLASGNLKAGGPELFTGSNTSAYVEIHGASTNLLVANLFVQTLTKKGIGRGYLLREMNNAVGIGYPHGVSVYKRGTIDDLALHPGTRVADLPSVALDDGYVQGITSGLSKSSTGTGYQALRIGDDASSPPQQYKTILSFDTSVIPVGSTVVSAQLSLMLGGIKGSVLSSPFPSTFLADIGNGGLFGAAGLELTDFNYAAGQVAVATFSVPTTVGSLTLASLTSGFSSINLSGKTQFRLYFTTANDGDAVADYLGFYSGNDADPGKWPSLRVVYRLP
jgi:hypothetical protein